MLKQLAHLCLKTDQLPVMIAFYRDIIGLPIKFALKDDHGVEFGYYFDLGNRTFLEVFDHQLSARQWKLPTDAIVRTPVMHYSHFCFESDNLEKLKAVWESRGLKSTEIKTGLDGSRQMWITDPDGNAIEVMQYTAVSLQMK
jgi:catechol 2,3-dioxygenase-like lactoylglutathione lyase family enzyme